MKSVEWLHLPTFSEIILIPVFLGMNKEKSINLDNIIFVYFCILL